MSAPIMIDLRLGDCLEIMRGLPDASVDAVITDPPYGNAYYDSDTAVTKETWLEIASRVKQTVCVFGYFVNLFELWQLFAGEMKLLDYIAWCPTNPTANRYGHLRREHQDILAFGRQDAVWNADTVRGKPYARKDCLHYRSDGARFANEWQPHSDGRRWGDVWTDPQPNVMFNSAKRLHPNEKPQAIMERLIALSTNEGATVLDPFMGSGTTGVACVKLNRSFIGIEINERYYNIAQKRIAEAQKQMVLL